MKVNIGFPVVRTDGQRAGGRTVYGHVITKFSWMGRFLSYGAPPTRAFGAPLLLLLGVIGAVTPQDVILTQNVITLTQNVKKFSTQNVIISE